MPYCLYLRKSRADLELEAKGEMETLARHKKTLLDLAKRMKLPISAVYEEIVSGETIESRPVVRQLLDEVEQGAWDGVLVMEVERLARGDTIDQGIVARAFKIGHTKIITPLKVYDPENEYDEEYFEFGLFMSRREYKTINRRIQRGRVASAKEGKFLGSTPPYGYDKVKIKGDKGYTLALNEESPVVKTIYDRYIDGIGMDTIAQYLDSIGIKPRYRDSWSKSTISDILSNPVYAGKLRWSYRIEKKYIDDGKILKKRTVNDTPIYVDGLHPAIISEDTFSQAQIIRKRNTIKTIKKNLSLQNPLSGIVYCGLCGQRMTRLGHNSRNKYDTLHCPNRACHNISAPIFLIEKKLTQELKSLASDHTIKLNNDYPQQDTGGLKLRQKSLKAVKQELDKVQSQIGKTFDLLEQGVYTVEIFTARNKDLEDRKTSLQKQSDDLQKEIKQICAAQSMVTDQLPRMISLLKSYETTESIEGKNEILHELLYRVEYTKTSPNTRGNLLNDNFKLVLLPKLGFSNN